MSLLNIRKKSFDALFALCTLCAIAFLAACAGRIPAAQAKPPVVHIAWRPSIKSDTYQSVLLALKNAGADTPMLPQVRSQDILYNENGMVREECLTKKGMIKLEYAQKIRENGEKRSNVAEIVRKNKIKAVVFTGGGDISPSLFNPPEEEQNAGESFEPERDVSDFLLMEYCLEHDIPILAICRGMQMLAVITDGTIVQDFSLYYNERGQTYDNMHRQPPSENQDYAVHDVAVTSADSIFRHIVGADALSRVPSWHHQGVLQTEKSRFVTTGYTVTSGIPLVEAMEVPGKKFALGVQFHPEIVVSGNPEGKEKEFFDYDTAMRFFEAIAGK